MKLRPDLRIANRYWLASYSCRRALALKLTIACGTELIGLISISSTIELVENFLLRKLDKILNLTIVVRNLNKTKQRKL